MVLRIVVSILALASCAIANPVPPQCAVATPLSAPANARYTISSYGPTLVKNKHVLADAFNKAGTPTDLRALFLAMGFQESTHLTGRDFSKDGRKDGAANHSLFNINESMLTQLGYKGSFSVLDTDQGLPTMLKLMQKGIELWGVRRFLAYVRGGTSAWCDLTSYDTAGYANAIATMVRVIGANKALFVNDQRINIDTKHV